MLKDLKKKLLGRNVKGNISSAGEKIYYTSDHRLFEAVVPEQWFRSVEAAEKAGFRKPKR